MIVRTWILANTNKRSRHDAICAIRGLPFKPIEILRVNPVHGEHSINKDGAFSFHHSSLVHLDVMKWCFENCSGQFDTVRKGYYYAFQLDSDAVLFKLMWG